jgi:hypothetical protein
MLVVPLCRSRTAFSPSLASPTYSSYLILLLMPRPTSHNVSLLPFLSATLLPGPRSSPCRPDAIALQLPRHHSALGSSFQFQGGLRSAAYHHLTPHWPPDLQGQNKLIRPMHRLLSSWRLFLLLTQPSVPIVSMI